MYFAGSHSGPQEHLKSGAIHRYLDGEKLKQKELDRPLSVKRPMIRRGSASNWRHRTGVYPSCRAQSKKAIPRHRLQDPNRLRG